MPGYAIVEIDGVQPTAAGELPVVSLPPEPPPGTTPVAAAGRISEGDVSNTSPQELVYVIPDGQTLTVTRLVAASEASNNGARVDLVHRPDGTAGTEARVTAPVFLNADTKQLSLGRKFTGDGVHTIVLRLIALSGGTTFIYGEWDGFLE